MHGELLLKLGRETPGLPAEILLSFNELHLKRTLRAYFYYYHKARTHLALDKQCPEPRSVELPGQGTVIAFPHVGGLHHEYRRAA